MNIDYKTLSDEQLVLLAQFKDDLAMTEILERYKKFVKKIARAYYLLGGDNEDIIQEGTISVFRAVQTYKSGASFSTYAYQCVKNGIISLVRKNFASNVFEQIPLELFLVNEEISSFNAGAVNPETKFINEETEKEFEKKLKDSLSDLEFLVLKWFLQGYSYDEIGLKIKKSSKSVDNALQRIKRKILLTYGG